MRNLVAYQKRSIFCCFSKCLSAPIERTDFCSKHSTANLFDGMQKEFNIKSHIFSTLNIVLMRNALIRNRIGFFCNMKNEMAKYFQFLSMEKFSYLKHEKFHLPIFSSIAQKILFLAAVYSPRQL